MPEISLPAREPAAVIGAGAVALTAVLTVASFFVPLSDALQDAIVTAAVTSAVFVVAVVALIRPRVTPNAKVAERVEGSLVVAGPANDLRGDGDTVRRLGDPAPARARDDDGDGIPDYTPEG